MTREDSIELELPRIVTAMMPVACSQHNKGCFTCRCIHASMQKS